MIRLRRAGSKKRPFFRVVVTDSRRPQQPAEILDTTIHALPAVVQSTRARDYWLKKGAQPSDSVRTRLRAT
jgi:small subunit ribosomal protein S16